MQRLERIVLFRATRKFRQYFMEYTLYQDREGYTVSIVEKEGGSTHFASAVTFSQYSEKTCRNFLRILSDTLTFPEQLLEIVTDNDLELLE